jgi:Fe2+ transport system protein FeoA
MTLNESRSNQLVTIVKVNNRNGFGLRLSELGFVPGTKVTLMNRISDAGPFMVHIGSFLLALRLEEASEIEIKLG